jgi:hypothetical protein
MLCTSLLLSKRQRAKAFFVVFIEYDALAELTRPYPIHFGLMIFTGLFESSFFRCCVRQAGQACEGLREGSRSRIASPPVFMVAKLKGCLYPLIASGFNGSHDGCSHFNTGVLKIRLEPGVASMQPAAESLPAQASCLSSGCNSGPVEKSEKRQLSRTTARLCRFSSSFDSLHELAFSLESFPALKPGRFSNLQNDLLHLSESVLALAFPQTCSHTTIYLED